MADWISLNARSLGVVGASARRTKNAISTLACLVKNF
jgi:hypothetical protein